MKYYSQANQDKWVAENLAFKKNGYFVEVGAYDGIQTSNTYFFEKELGWNGICIEANSMIFQRLKNNRISRNVCSAVTDYKGECLFSEDKITSNGYPIPCDTLENIFVLNSAPHIIDYLSIDIEGGELTALKDFPFSKFKIGLITVEHNLYLDGSAKKEALFALLSQNGFTRLVEDAKCLDPHPSCFMKPYEDWYVNVDLHEFQQK